MADAFQSLTNHMVEKKNDSNAELTNYDSYQKKREEQRPKKDKKGYEVEWYFSGRGVRQTLTQRATLI